MESIHYRLRKFCCLFTRSVLVGAVAILSACSDNHSVLQPRGPAAERIADLSWIMFAGAAAILALVVVILLYVVFSKPQHRRAINHNRFIIAGGVVLPVVTLSVLLFFVFRIGAELTAAPREQPLIIEVTAHQWWWELRYISEEPFETVLTANEIHIPIGQPVEFRLKTADVIHSFWVPSLGGKRDMIPGIVNTLQLQADEEGVYFGTCNEFCGAQHALMRLLVVAEPPGDFARWLERQRLPAREPLEPLEREGKVAFMQAGCPFCHTVRGTKARGGVAPELTHFGSRLTIAAGTMPNDHARRIAWIVSPEHFKPETKMPAFILPGYDVRAISAYLGSLE